MYRSRVSFGIIKSVTLIDDPDAESDGGYEYEYDYKHKDVAPIGRVRRQRRAIKPTWERH